MGGGSRDKMSPFKVICLGAMLTRHGIMMVNLIYLLDKV